MYGFQGGKAGGGKNQEIGIDAYTLLTLSINIKQRMNENLLYSTGDSTQSFVVTHMEKGSKRSGYTDN